jgi:hypothetical protein
MKFGELGRVGFELEMTVRGGEDLELRQLGKLVSRFCGIFIGKVNFLQVSD